MRPRNDRWPLDRANTKRLGKHWESSLAPELRADGRPNEAAIPGQCGVHKCYIWELEAQVLNLPQAQVHGEFHDGLSSDD
jgi:hypothetical protein